MPRRLEVGPRPHHGQVLVLVLVEKHERFRGRSSQESVLLTLFRDLFDVFLRSLQALLVPVASIVVILLVIEKIVQSNTSVAGALIFVFFDVTFTKDLLVFIDHIFLLLGLLRAMTVGDLRRRGFVFFLLILRLEQFLETLI